MSDPLDIVKFVCKDFWDDVFLKKVNNTRYDTPTLSHTFLSCPVDWQASNESPRGFRVVRLQV